MNFITKVRRWTWELPQSLLGLILIPFYKDSFMRKELYKDQWVYIYEKFPGGISLGNYQLVKYGRGMTTIIKHEYGHCIQSKYLGPLYLPIIGVCSSIHNLVCRIKKYKKIPYNYYSFWTEKWADKLGEVKRK